MKRLLLSILICILVACSKEDGRRSSAIYYFEVEENAELTTSKAIWNKEDQVVIWEEGDEISFTIELYDNRSAKMMSIDGGNVKVFEKEIDGKLVFENNAWKTFIQNGDSFTEVEGVEVEAPSLDSYVTFRYRYGNFSSFCASWFMTVDFVEGNQTIPVQVPWA